MKKTPFIFFSSFKRYCNFIQLANAASAPPPATFGPSSNLASDMILPPQSSEEVSIQHKTSRSVDQTTSPIQDLQVAAAAGLLPAGGTAPTPSLHELPETITLDVELVKDSQGLGVTIAGYTSEREELSGIFVKSVTEGSAAHRYAKHYTRLW